MKTRALSPFRRSLTKMIMCTFKSATQWIKWPTTLKRTPTMQSMEEISSSRPVLRVVSSSYMQLRLNLSGQPLYLTLRSKWQSVCTTKPIPQAERLSQKIWEQGTLTMTTLMTIALMLKARAALLKYTREANQPSANGEWAPRTTTDYLRTVCLLLSSKS